MHPWLGKESGVIRTTSMWSGEIPSIMKTSYGVVALYLSSYETQRHSGAVPGRMTIR